MQLQRLFLPSCPSDLELSTVLVDDVLYPDIDVEDVQEPDFLLCLDGFDELDNCVSKKGVNKGFRRGSLQLLVEGAGDAVLENG